MECQLSKHQRQCLQRSRNRNKRKTLAEEWLASRREAEFYVPDKEKMDYGLRLCKFDWKTCSAIAR